MQNSINAATVDAAPTQEDFMDEVVSGLREELPQLPCKYFYDARGSQLFDEICELDEYYLTRTELEIMRRHAPEMAEQIGPGVMLVEYGSGSSMKTRLLLEHLKEPVAYVPVDISRKYLRESAIELRQSFPNIEILPVCADFTEPFGLPVSSIEPTHSAVYFPGSTIGNFPPATALALLAKIAPLCGKGGGLLIGIDLQKDIPTIEAAYNDELGVTAAFNLNLLERINRELGADFDSDQFEHSAQYNSSLGRVEIALVSQCYQAVSLNGDKFTFSEGQEIRTEYSYKYTIDSFAEIAAGAGLTLRRAWTDEQDFVAVLHFAVVK